VAYLVEMERSFRAVQGLPSPIRTRRGEPPVDGFDVVLRAGVAFGDDQLTGRGWFFDTDAADEVLDALSARLAGRPWTDLFDFRPTFELVARHVFGELSGRLAQLSYVELVNRTLGVTTRYAG
jgi:6-pyruvoyltetrahydropterin/6-carboxytetrahydropterin synthase